VALAGHGFDLIGVSLFGPKPLEAVHMELGQGLSVLYGLNGSGKTTILREAEAVLRGIGPGQPGGVSSRQSCLHVRFSSLQENSDAFERSQFEKSLTETFLALEGQEKAVPPHATRFERWQWMLNEVLCRELESDWIWEDALLAHQDTVSFSLVPTGTPAQPAWGSYFSARLSEVEWAALNDHMERLRELHKKVQTGANIGRADIDLAISGQNPVQDFGETPWTQLVAGKGVPGEDYLGQWPAHFPLPLAPFGCESQR